jgi:hypothetical protein
MSVLRRAGVATLSAALVALGCTNSAGPGGDEIRILLNNGDVDGSVSVTVDGPSFSPTTVGISFGNFNSDEYPGVLGDVITIDASRAAGNGLPAIAGSGSCRAGPTMVGRRPHPMGAEYGQINFGTNGASISVTCSSGWQ